MGCGERRGDKTRKEEEGKKRKREELGGFRGVGEKGLGDSEGERRSDEKKHFW